MATGTYQIPKDTTPSSILPYKAGDTITLVNGNGPYFNFLANTKLIRTYFPLPKPINASSVKISGPVKYRIGSSTVDVTHNNLAGSILPNGISWDYTHGSNVGTQNAVGNTTMAGNVTITFS